MITENFEDTTYNGIGGTCYIGTGKEAKVLWDCLTAMYDNEISIDGKDIYPVFCVKEPPKIIGGGRYCVVVYDNGGFELRRKY